MNGLRRRWSGDVTLPTSLTGGGLDVGDGAKREEMSLTSFRFTVSLFSGVFSLSLSLLKDRVRTDSSECPTPHLHERKKRGIPDSLVQSQCSVYISYLT